MCDCPVKDAGFQNLSLQPRCRPSCRRLRLSQPPWHLEPSTKWQSWVSSLFSQPALQCLLEFCSAYIVVPRGNIAMAQVRSSSSNFPALERMRALICSLTQLWRLFAGAAGGIGQPLALLLKGSPSIGELSLYDIVGTQGVGADLSHIDSSAKVQSCGDLAQARPLHGSTLWDSLGAPWNAKPMIGRGLQKLIPFACSVTMAAAYASRNASAALGVQQAGPAPAERLASKKANLLLACPQVTSHTGPEKLPEALYNCALVVIPAGVPRKPGMTRDDLFNINASALRERRNFRVLGFQGAFVVIPAGVPRKPGMTRDDLFNINASAFREAVPGLACMFARPSAWALLPASIAMLGQALLCGSARVPSHRIEHCHMNGHD